MSGRGPPRSGRRTGWTRWFGPATLGVLLLLTGCGDDGAVPPPGSETISRDVFVETYVDLRVQVLRSGREEITPSDRDRILVRHEVTQEDLLRFVEVHGDRLHFMRGVWDEIQARIDSIRSAGDSATI